MPHSSMPRLELLWMPMTVNTLRPIAAIFCLALLSCRSHSPAPAARSNAATLTEHAARQDGPQQEPKPPIQPPPCERIEHQSIPCWGEDINNPTKLSGDIDWSMFPEGPSEGFHFFAKLCIDERGRVCRVLFIEAPAPQIDAPLCEVLRTWLYKPMTKNGAPCPSVAYVSGHFDPAR